MEVMSSLLLCALVAFLPQGLGKQTVKANNRDVKLNSSIMIQKNSFSPHKLLINLKEPLPMGTVHLKNVYNDHSCKKCLKCMDRAIKAFASHHRVNSQELYYELLTNKINQRIKRDVNGTDITEFKLNKDKKLQTKKNKVHKTVTVTKYNLEGVVTALKVRETSAASLTDPRKPSVETCEVYSIKKYYPCHSVEGELMIKLAKRKTGKKGKKEKEKYTEITTEQTKEIHSPMYRKREVDNTQLPENVMSSVEDFY